MARESGGLCTTRCQLFNSEIIKKENTLRIKWFIKNRQRLLDNLRDDKLVKRAKELRNKSAEERLNKQQESLKEVEEEKPLPVWRPRKEDGSMNLDTMRPVDPAVRAILYETGVESYITGNNYLRERCTEKPEDRYYYPDCTNWLYGWRLTDHPPVPATKVGRTSIIRETFYRRNASSLQREPDSQRPCQTTNSKNYNEILTY